MQQKDRQQRGNCWKALNIPGPLVGNKFLCSGVLCHMIDEGINYLYPNSGQEQYNDISLTNKNDYFFNIRRLAVKPFFFENTSSPPWVVLEALLQNIRCTIERCLYIYLQGQTLWYNPPASPFKFYGAKLGRGSGFDKDTVLSTAHFVTGQMPTHVFKLVFCLLSAALLLTFFLVIALFLRAE